MIGGGGGEENKFDFIGEGRGCMAFLSQSFSNGKQKCLRNNLNMNEWIQAPQI